MDDKNKYISNDDTQNYPSCRLKLVVEMFELNESSNQNSRKSPKLLNQRIRKRYYETFGTSVINSLLFPPSLGN